MDADYTVYLTLLNDEELGLFWIIASPRARHWIRQELVRRAVARGELPLPQTLVSPSIREAVVAA